MLKNIRPNTSQTKLNLQERIQNGFEGDTRYFRIQCQQGNTLNCQLLILTKFGIKNVVFERIFDTIRVFFKSSMLKG